ECKWEAMRLRACKWFPRWSSSWTSISLPPFLDYGNVVCAQRGVGAERDDERLFVRARAVAVVEKLAGRGIVNDAVVAVMGGGADEEFSTGQRIGVSAERGEDCVVELDLVAVVGEVGDGVAVGGDGGCVEHEFVVACAARHLVVTNAA